MSSFIVGFIFGLSKVVLNSIKDQLLGYVWIFFFPPFVVQLDVNNKPFNNKSVVYSKNDRSALTGKMQRQTADYGNKLNALEIQSKQQHGSNSKILRWFSQNPYGSHQRGCENWVLLSPPPHSP